MLLQTPEVLGTMLQHTWSVAHYAIYGSMQLDI